MSPATASAAARAAGGVQAMVVLHYAGSPAPVDELAEAAGVPMSRVVEDAAHAVGTYDGDGQVGSRSRPPASASTPPRTCRSARAAWSPPTTASWPTACGAPAARHVARRLAPLRARRVVALRRRGGRAQGQHDRRGGGHRAGAAAPRRRDGRSGARPSPATTASAGGRARAGPAGGAGRRPPRLAPLRRPGQARPGRPRRARRAAGARHRDVGALHPAPPPDVPPGCCRCPCPRRSGPGLPRAALPAHVPVAHPRRGRPCLQPREAVGASSARRKVIA